MTDETAAFCRMYYVLGGTCHYSDADGRRRLERGRLYLLPQFRPYTLWHDREAPFFVLWQHVRVPGCFIRKLQETDIRPQSAAWHLLSVLTALTSGALIEAMPEQRGESAARLESLLSVLLSVLEEEAGQPFEPLDERLGRVWSLCRQDSLVSVLDMAQAANMERSYFSRQFKSWVGIFPQRYLLTARINEAAHLLLSGSTVAETGAALGYTDVKAFSRAFVSVMRQSPAQYKKSHILQP